MHEHENPNPVDDTFCTGLKDLEILRLKIGKSYSIYSSVAVHVRFSALLLIQLTEHH